MDVWIKGFNAAVYLQLLTIGSFPVQTSDKHFSTDDKKGKGKGVTRTSVKEEVRRERVK